MPSVRLRAGLFLALACALGLSSCSSDAPSDVAARAGSGAFVAPEVTMPERRPDATVIIESVKWGELVVIEIPQEERRAGSGARTGSGAGGFGGMAAGRAGGATTATTAAPRLIGGGAMRFGGRGGGQQSSEELEKLLKSGKRFRVKVPVGIPVAVSGTESPVPEAGSFADIRTGYRATLWLGGTGALRTAEAVTILGKVSR